MTMRRNAVNWTWRSSLALAILTNLVGWLYQPDLVNLLRQWWSGQNYSHGFLIPAMGLCYARERIERSLTLNATNAVFRLSAPRSRTDFESGLNVFVGLQDLGGGTR